MEVIYLVSLLLMYWAGLMKDEDKEFLKTGANMLMQSAATMYTQGHEVHGEVPTRVLMITEA